MRKQFVELDVGDLIDSEGLCRRIGRVDVGVVRRSGHEARPTSAASARSPLDAENNPSPKPVTGGGGGVASKDAAVERT